MKDIIITITFCWKSNLGDFFSCLVATLNVDCEMCCMLSAWFAAVILGSQSASSLQAAAVGHSVHRNAESDVWVALSVVQRSRLQSHQVLWMFSSVQVFLECHFVLSCSVFQHRQRSAAVQCWNYCSNNLSLNMSSETFGVLATEACLLFFPTRFSLLVLEISR